MADQAESLRQRLSTIKKKENQASKVLAVVSGKGGVGKSNFSLNFAIGLSNRNYKVLVIDLDIGMGNINILMGQSSRFTIADYFTSGIPLREIVEEGPAGIRFIAGGSGLTHIFTMESRQFELFSGEFEQILGEYDYILLDMGAGATEHSLQFIRSADELIVLTTPEPTAIMDAYSMVKYLFSSTRAPIYLVCNKSLRQVDGIDTLKRLQNAATQFLNREIQSLGVLPDDKAVQKAVNRQIPFLILEPRAPISMSFQQIINAYLGEAQSEVSVRLPFMEKLKNYLFER